MRTDEGGGQNSDSRCCMYTQYNVAKMLARKNPRQTGVLKYIVMYEKQIES